MANFQFTSDILADALFRAGEPTDGTSDYAAEVLTYLNNVYYQVCRGGSELSPSIYEDWAWLRKPLPGTLILKPAINAGTVTVTQNSTGITFTSGPAPDVDNYFFKVSTHPDVFRIAAHTAGSTSATLDSVYTGPTVSGAGYTLYILEYNLASDVMRIVAPMRTRVAVAGEWCEYKIHRSDPDTMDDSYPPGQIIAGVPDLFAEVGETTQGTRRIRFNRYISPSLTNYVRVEYEYLVRPTTLTSPGTSEEPVLPLEWRHVLADFVLAYLFGAKDDSRAPAAAQAAQAGLLGMAKENRYQMATASKHYFRLYPRMERWSRGPLRTESGLILG